MEHPEDNCFEVVLPYERRSQKIVLGLTSHPQRPTSCGYWYFLKPLTTSISIRFAYWMAHAIHDGRRLLWRTTSWLQHHWTICQSCMRQERSGHRHPKWCWDRTPVSNLTLGTSWSLIRHCAPQLDGRANCCANGRLLMAMLQQKVQQSARTSVAGPNARTSGAGPSAKTYAAKRTIAGSERSKDQVGCQGETQTTKEGTDAPFYASWRGTIVPCISEQWQPLPAQCFSALCAHASHHHRVIRCSPYRAFIVEIVEVAASKIFLFSPLPGEDFQFD